MTYRENNIDNFYPSPIDENSETSEGFAPHWDELDDPNLYSDIYITRDPVEADNLFGRNKAKKAEKKVQKAQKQLAKGHVKKAEKKLKKAEKIQSSIAGAQTKLLSAAQKQRDINATQQNLNTMSTAANESMQTEAGQIGLAGMPTQQTQAQANLNPIGGGGGGGDMDSGMATMDAGAGGGGGGSDEPTGALAEEKTLEGVTVKAGKATNKKILLYVGIGVAALIIILLAAKYLKKQPKVK